MKLKIFLTIVAVIFVVLGIGFLVMPVQITAMHGITLNAGSALLTRVLGSSLLGFGLIYWWSRNSAPSAALTGVLWASVVYNAIDALVSLQGMLAGTANALGWSFVVLHTLLTIGFVYFAFGKR